MSPKIPAPPWPTASPPYSPGSTTTITPAPRSPPSSILAQSLSAVTPWAYYVRGLQTSLRSQSRQPSSYKHSQQDKATAMEAKSYSLGFINLSHFFKVFEELHQMKPEKAIHTISDLYIVVAYIIFTTTIN